MSLFGLMNTAISGLGAQASKLSTIGDNVANSSTTGYKDAEAEFETILGDSGTSTYSSGGVSTHVRYNVTGQGTKNSTTSTTDMMVSGNGLFIVKAADGTTASVALNGGDTSSARASKAGSRASRTAVVAGASDRASDASPIPRGPYTLDAGVRLDLQTALDERNRIQALTGIEGWVAPAAAPGDQEYRIVLGIFRSYARARAAANMLMRSRTLSHVTVVSMPARSTRQ